MKKILFFVVTALLLFPVISSNVQAEANIAVKSPVQIPMIMNPVYRKQVNLFGQNHYYTVTFRENGEAVVTFKAILSNTGDNPIDTVSLHYASNIDPKDITIFEVIQSPQCIRFEQLETYPQQFRQTCAEYQEPDYQYLGDNTTYQNIPFDLTNNSIILHLPTSIESNKSGSYFVYYRTNEYAKKNLFGAYDFNFESLKIDDKINSLQVGINTDSDFYLRGAKGDVQYSNTNADMAALPMAAADHAIKSQQFDQFYNQIGSGTITKTASDLQSLESYKVQGQFADNQIKLYGREITWAIIIILLMLLVLIVVLKKIFKHVFGNRQIKSKSVNNIAVSSQTKTLFISIGVSFLSALLLTIYSVGVFLLTQMVNTMMMDQYTFSSYNGMQFLFLTVISIAVYILFLLGPAIGMGIKKGLGWGLVMFAATVFWTVIFLILSFAILFFLFPNNNIYPHPLPMMGVQGKAAPAANSTTAQ